LEIKIKPILITWNVKNSIEFPIIFFIGAKFKTLNGRNVKRVRTTKPWNGLTAKTRKHDKKSFY